MKSYCYDFEKAKNEKLVVNVVAEAIKIIIIGAVCLLCALGIPMYFPQVWVIGPVLAIATLAFVIYGVLRTVNNSGMERMSVVQGSNGELYVFKNNNSMQNSWVPMVNTFFKNNLLIGAGVSALAVKNVNDALKIQNAIREIMSNEQFLNHIIENPNDKICNGIEKYKILKVLSCEKQNKKVKICFDAYEMGLGIIERNVSLTVNDVFNDFEDMVGALQSYKNQEESALKINEKNEKSYKAKFKSNYSISVVLVVVQALLAVLGIVNVLVFKLNPILFLIAGVLAFCITMAVFEPLKNTNIEGKNIKSFFGCSIVFLFADIVICIAMLAM